jgi:hypothetical protein
MNYQKIKSEIRARANDFFLIEDLFALADSYILAEDILNQKDFPIEEYKKWKRKKE